MVTDTESKRKQEKISNRERTTNINLKWIYALVILGGEFVISYSWELVNPDAIKVRQIGDLFFEYVFLPLNLRLLNLE